MADLPHNRLYESSLLAHCPLGIVGPFLIEKKQNILKHYRALLTSLENSDIYVEMIKSLGTDSFLIALRCFIERPGVRLF